MRLSIAFACTIAKLLVACENEQRATAAPEVPTAKLRQMKWETVRNERDVCQHTALRMPQEGPQSTSLLCEVVSRAWTAITANPAALAVVNRDAAGSPVKAYLHFVRIPAALGAEAKFPETVGWQVDFPSAADTVGISVTVDSATGKAYPFADHRFGFPYRDLMSPRVPEQKR